MFTIPNAADAEHVSQAQVDARDFSGIVIPAFSGTGVVSGCAVTPQAIPDMTVAVASGMIAVAGVIAPVTGGNVTITTAHATLPRFDLVVVDNVGAKSVVAGTAAAAPIFPDPAGKVVLAAVRVPATITAINVSKIVDKRVNAVYQGIWTPYVPAFTAASGTAPNLGNATVNSAYTQMGKTIFYYGYVIFGSGSSFGSGGVGLRFSLPVPPVAGLANNPFFLGTTQYHKADFSNYLVGTAQIQTGNVFIPSYSAAYAGTMGGMSAGGPFAWTTGDSIAWNFTYPAA